MTPVEEEFLKPIPPKPRSFSSHPILSKNLHKSTQGSSTSHGFGSGPIKAQVVPTPRTHMPETGVGSLTTNSRTPRTHKTETGVGRLTLDNMKQSNVLLSGTPRGLDTSSLHTKMMPAARTLMSETGKSTSTLGDMRQSNVLLSGTPRGLDTSSLNPQIRMSTTRTHKTGTVVEKITISDTENSPEKKRICSQINTIAERVIVDLDEEKEKEPIVERPKLG
jgi:uncharacterized protein YheU (UPF0270 family)